ncbi:MAG: MFS transporter [Haloarculaceae archaeon]
MPVAGLVYVAYPEPVEPRERRAGVSFLSEFREYFLDIWSAGDRSLALPFAGGFVLFFLKGVVRTFLAVFVTTGLGAPVAVAGTVLGVYGGARVLMAPLSGTLVARLGRRVTLLLGTCAVALGMAGVPLAPNLWVVGLAAVCYGGGEGVLNPVLNDAVAAFASVDQRAGIVSGLMLSKQVAIIVSPPLVGIVIGLYGFATAFLLTAALAVAYALLLLVARGP